MRTLTAAVLRLLLLAVFVFFFVVLFEHGPSGFVQGIPKEFSTFIEATGLPLGWIGTKRTPSPDAGPYREPDLPTGDGSESPSPITPDLSTPRAEGAKNQAP